MCGIFGIIANPSSGIDSASLRRVVRRMFDLSEVRGKDASGVIALTSTEIAIFKLPERAKVLVRRREFRDLLHDACREYEAGSPLVIAGHTRMVTNGSEWDERNNQPIIKDGYVILHNGIIVNDSDLWLKHRGLKREFDVDTEAFGALLALHRNGGGSFGDALRFGFSEARGANTVAAFGAQEDSIQIGTTNGSMYYWHDQSSASAAFASERMTLERSAAILRDVVPRARQNIVQLKPGRCLSISIATTDMEETGMTPVTSTSDAGGAGTGDASRASREIRVVSRERMTNAGHRAPMLIDNDFGRIEHLMRIDNAAIDLLRRCTLCLLPETFPFIEFNAQGVCQFCEAHEPPALRQPGDLERLAEQVRRAKKGDSDCLVPISGGRDSCYGLHYAKRVLGLNPVAYTYDWGFVTDLARRNISRVCEHLSVEHVLVAADIRKKRENVRKNVVAWMKRPQLGMIPLFMAGDKMFFYYASLLRRQMGLEMTLFSMNWLEKTGFKAGFSGVNDTAKHEKTYGMTAANKLRLVGYYAKEFVANPAYVNSSVPDTIFGFLSYFMQRKDYHSLFDYIPWDQHEIEQTIIGYYDWETSPDSKSTWRIGDGTAPFYNYIYQAVAGFSEHDTFRSNQIRLGLITREDGLSLIKEENRPRVESFKWYCDAVGIDAAAALNVINAIPKRYAV